MLSVPGISRLNQYRQVVKEFDRKANKDNGSCKQTLKLKSPREHSEEIQLGHQDSVTKAFLK